MADRLPQRPGEEIDRQRTLTFRFDGREYPAYAGDTIGSALAAARVDVLSRSFKYHRPRGLLCCAGRCPNCMVEVDGSPNVRACTERVRDGMVVRGQNAWPSAAHDLMSVFDRLDRFLPVGFYYKTFIRPRWLWPAYETVLRRLAGVGKVDPESRPHRESRKLHLHCDVAVVGAGPAGALAALSAADAGARVVLIDDQPAPGGHLRWSDRPVFGDPRMDGLGGTAAAARLSELLRTSRIEYLPNATAFGIYEGNLIGVSRGNDMLRVRARQTIVATGGIERPMLFQNNDRPGVMLASAALRLASLFRVQPGDRAVVATESDHGWQAAVDLMALGISVAAVVDSRSSDSQRDMSLVERVRQHGARVIDGGRVVDTKGATRVSGVVVETGGSRQSISSDLVVVATRPEPEIGLLGQAGVGPAYDEASGLFVPGAAVDGILAVGHVTGAADDPAAIGEAWAAGHAAALYATGRTNGAGNGRHKGGGMSWTESRPGLARAPGAPATQSPSALGRAPRGPATPGQDLTRQVPAVKAAVKRRKAFVCLCEDVTVKDVRGALLEGFDSLETLKRYSTVTMGPCQGKMCHAISARVHAALTDQNPAATGLTTSRPPYQPVPLTALAGPHLSPVRRTPLHERHESLAATWTDMGDWKRPLYYTSIDDECRAVRQAVGIIDVSTLGKLELNGRDVGEFLDWLHPNRFSDLRTGRVRYRVMCDDAGIVLDDGTVARLGPDRFFLTTGTTAFDAVDQWLEWWLAGSSRDLHSTNVTSQYAAVNLAGPRAREVIGRLTPMDVSPKAMPYLAAVQGEVAGIPAIILRIGFVGELGYEIHVPADSGAHLWDSLMEAGRELGIRPFGVEAQRVLRLEKQHIIPGQDTDALSNPIEAGLDWAVKAEKPDFIGRDALARVALAGKKSVLVGFEVAGRELPAEGAAIVQNGRAAGRVTSCKWSPTLERGIGLGWVPAADAKEGASLTIRLGVGTAGRTTIGVVRLNPFYDADGARLRA